MKMFQTDCGDARTTLCICKQHQTIHFEWVNCMVYILYLDKVVFGRGRKQKWQ